MTERFATSSFGGRMMSAAHFLNAETLRQQQKHASSNPLNTSTHKPATDAVDRWKLLRALTEARAAYAISHRTIAVLETLLSFHGDKTLDGSKPLIVFPSNNELSLRLRGMSAPSIRRHIASLVSLGFIMRRDSPNGKRYVRRDDCGDIQCAFGFDLAPFALKASEIEHFAAHARQEIRQRQLLRCNITIHLRDIAKTIEAAIYEQHEGEWAPLQLRLEALSGRVERNGTILALSQRETALKLLRQDVENLYLSMISEQEISASVRHNEHHIQNSDIESIDLRAIEKTPEDNPSQTEPNDHAENLTRSRSRLNHTADRDKSHPQLQEVLILCPQMKDYARNGIHSWQDFVVTAAHIRLMLGISTSAWNEACNAMGQINAAITIATILERTEAIRSAGGYLRKLTERAVTGQYSIRPVLKALNNSLH